MEKVLFQEITKDQAGMALAYYQTIHPNHKANLLIDLDGDITTITNKHIDQAGCAEGHQLLLIWLGGWVSLDPEYISLKFDMTTKAMSIYATDNQGKAVTIDFTKGAARLEDHISTKQWMRDYQSRHGIH